MTTEDDVLLRENAVHTHPPSASSGGYSGVLFVRTQLHL